jgi:hypothetical protein
MLGAFDVRRRRAFVGLAVVLVAAAATPPLAEETKEAEPSSASKPAGKVDLGEVEIRGEIEKPKIFFILPKAQRDADAKQRRIRFYPDILEPLDKDRFEEEARVLYQHGIPAE